MSVEEKKPQPCYWNAALLLLFKNKQKRKLGCFCPASLIFYHSVLFQLQPTAPVILTLYTLPLCSPPRCTLGLFRQGEDAAVPTRIYPFLLSYNPTLQFFL